MREKVKKIDRLRVRYGRLATQELVAYAEMAQLERECARMQRKVIEAEDAVASAGVRRSAVDNRLDDARRTRGIAYSRRKYPYRVDWRCKARRTECDIALNNKNLDYCRRLSCAAWQHYDGARQSYEGLAAEYIDLQVAYERAEAKWKRFHEKRLEAYAEYQDFAATKKQAI